MGSIVRTTLQKVKTFFYKLPLLPLHLPIAMPAVLGNILSTILNRFKKLLQKTPLKPLQFPTTGYEVIGDDYYLDEEMCPEFHNGWYYPVHIGDVYADKYQVLGKLGYGRTSTVWLARNLLNHEYVALKVFQHGFHNDEFAIYQQLQNGNKKHPGYNYVQNALEQFTLTGPSGQHDVIVQQPMWDSIANSLFRIPNHRLPLMMLKPLLAQLFLGLDYLHTECQLVHTDIKAANILMRIADPSILSSFVEAELSTPSARKTVNGYTIYATRSFDRPKTFGRAILSDFGSTVRGDQTQAHYAQPNSYRSPEVMLEAGWGYKADIWNVACMAWELLEDAQLLNGNPERTGYLTRVHCAQIISVLGVPPLDLVKKGERSNEFFDEEGKWIADVAIPDASMEDAEVILEGKDKTEFLEFMKCMLRWRPEDRSTAKEMLDHPYLANCLR